MPNQDLLQVTRRYSRPHLAKSWFQLLNSAIPFLTLLLFMYWLAQYSYWYVLPVSVLCAGFLMRLFIIQHDCGHGSFFRSDFLNRWSGRVIGFFTFTPYSFWKSNHAAHHATSCDLDRRDIGDVSTMTVREYLAAAPLFDRLVYRFIRNPSLLSIGGPALFLFGHRFPWYVPAKERRLWASVLAYDLVMALTIWAIISWIGIMPLLIYLPVVCIAAAVGTYLFFIQHQFSGTYWQRREDWNFVDAAMRGSSYHKLPAVLNWFTGNIAFHHIHHLCSKIPNYELKRCYRENPALQDVRALGIREALACFRLALWDEDAKKLISFRELRSRR